MIAANAHQAGQVIRNVTGVRPGKMVSYEDLWRFTLVNYNTGPKYLTDTIEEMYVIGDKFT